MYIHIFKREFSSCEIPIVLFSSKIWDDGCHTLASWLTARIMTREWTEQAWKEQKAREEWVVSERKLRGNPSESETLKLFPLLRKHRGYFDILKKSIVRKLWVRWHIYYWNIDFSVDISDLSFCSIKRKSSKTYW